jgi:hypothetical protein
VILKKQGGSKNWSDRKVCDQRSFHRWRTLQSQRSFLSVNGGVSQSVEHVKYEKENSIWSQQVIELVGHSPKSCSRAESKVQVHTLHVIHG